MNDYLKNKNVRLRCKKSYPGAHTHIIIGNVETENEKYLAIRGRTYHFARIVDGLTSQVAVGIEMIRVIPWDNVEIIHWLGPNTDWNAEIDFDRNGNLYLKDLPRTIIAEKRAGLE